MERIFKHICGDMWNFVDDFFACSDVMYGLVKISVVKLDSGGVMCWWSGGNW